ncbi:hypothetical protein [Colwellia psychrerythraea]|uniref:Uncharacterized protein n=1 Tax=Colwellia psychrerythraea (strain 34H / ATCC BAA-681) TaxID=167879 RepID=Q48AF4_COLP3|nr:hypothetical protein [Colwellia psychrerythraea]AAZ24722.1 hypothetical protein CPS_0191 [Colwellia psychrerythraea 34H]
MKSDSKNERTLLPFVVLTGVVVAPIIFIAGIIFGTELNASIVLTSDSLSSWVAAIATVSIAVLTFILAKETWHLRNAQIEQLNEIKKESMRPNVVVNVQPSMVSISFWDVVIQNLGKGIAQNVNFEFKNIDGTVATDENNHLITIFSKLSLFENGCSSLGLGQSIKSFLFGFGDLKRDVGDADLFEQKIRLIIKFEDAEGNPYINSLDIDFNDYKGVSTLGGATDPTYSIFKELENIRKLFEPVFKTGFKRLKIDSFNSKDREQEVENRRLQEQEFLKQQEKLQSTANK